MASTYLPDGDTYGQEFDVDPSGMINTPRIVSGGVKEDYMRFTAFSELNFHLAASHFMHPDDLLDEDRGAALGWESAKDTIDEYMKWLNESAPPMRHLTGSGIAGAVQRYTNLILDVDQRDDGITIEVDGLIDSAYGYTGMITAGPMLLGIFYLMGIGGIGNHFGLEQHSRELLTSMISYNLLTSLIVTGFFSMVVTRYVSDLLYQDKEEEVIGSLSGSLFVILPIGCLLYGIFLIMSGSSLIQILLNLSMLAELLCVWMMMNYLLSLKM